MRREMEDEQCERTPGGDPGTQTGCRRRFPRQSIRRQAWLFEFSSSMSVSAPMACHTHDISRGGISVFTKRMIHAGRLVCVRIDSPDEGDKPRLLVGVVKTCRYDDEGLYITGVQFETPRQDGRLKAWLSAQAKKRPPDQHPG
ncbi:MAG: PilZ domain-containing protein [Phycisphaeraceae bacterium]|nr:PilZ domain-containing protein [Phycisphaeraceae bacterium]